MSKSNPFPVHDSDRRMLQRLHALPAAAREAEYTMLDEVDVLHAHGALYYRHEDGVVFTLDIDELGGELEIRLTEHVPSGAEPYDLIAGSRREALVDAWTEACDKSWKRSAFA